jgi:hypothetical protein
MFYVIQLMVPGVIGASGELALGPVIHVIRQEVGHAITLLLIMEA